MEEEREYPIEELIPIVVKLAQKYAGCDNTSVTYETAGQLMAAVRYCIAECGEKNALRRTDMTAEEAYRLGLETVIQKTNALRELYNEEIVHFQAYHNKCLYDTVARGIPEFLKWYDAKFNPQDTILTLDYPLLKDIHGLIGIDAVWEYMNGICLEQSFLSKLEESYLLELLSAYSPGYRGLVENIVSIVLPSVVGHFFLDKPLWQRGFTEEDYERLRERLSGRTKEEITMLITHLIGSVSANVFADKGNLCEYLCCEAENMAVRIQNAFETKQLQRIFIL